MVPMSDLLAQLAQSVTRSNGLESLTRPLLELLENVTGLESAFLTTVDEAAGRLEVRFAHNSGELQITEGTVLEWSDTLCRRAILENSPCIDDVPARWPDSKVGRDLGITTYVTVPVHARGGELVGTLCAASRDHRPLAPESQNVFSLFSRLIGQQVERERLLVQLQAANDELLVHASTDVLTGLPNRRAVREAIAKRLREVYPERRRVHVGFVDLDGFKAINDNHGHEVGDQFLRAMAARLSSALRPGDAATAASSLAASRSSTTGPASAWSAAGLARSMSTP